MALVQCEECGKPVSTKAAACPHCGVAHQKKKRKGWSWLYVLPVLIIFSVIIAPRAQYVLKEVHQQKKLKKLAAEHEKIFEEKFLEDLKGHYRKLAAYIRYNHFDRAKIMLALFKQYEQMEYGDVREYEKRIKIHDLEQKVKKVPASETQENIDLYNELVSLNPKSQRYKNKVAYYRAQKQREDKEREERIAKFGEPPSKSGLDGSIECVKEYLKTVAYDSASLSYDQWSDVYYSENDGWLVKCEFRGKNPFGGYVKHVKWFVIQHGRVVAIKDSTEYH